MKRYWNVIIGLIILVTILIGITSCIGIRTSNNAGEKQPKKLKIYFADAYRPDLNLVAEEVSKITMEEIGIGVEFIQFNEGEYSKKIQLLMDSNEEMDIIYDAQDSYVIHARNGDYLDITEYLDEKTPKLKKEIYDELWAGVTIDGKIYGVPTKKEIAEQPSLYVQKSFLEENNIDVASIKNLEDMEVVFEALKKDPKRAGFMINKGREHEGIYAKNCYESITGKYLITKDSDDKVAHYYLTEEYKCFADIMRDWYNKGYIASDVAVNGDYSQYINEDDRLGVRYKSYSPYEELTETDETQICKPIVFGNPIITNGSTRGSIFCVSKKSKHPEKAMEFLELWNTDPKVKNLITYGIEGKHYTLENGKVKLVPDKNNLYFNQNWRTGNMLISYLTVAEPDDKWEKFDEFNKNAEISKVLGFTPNIDSVKNEIMACMTVEAEYGSLISCGAVDPKEEIPKMIEALKAAGVDKVVAEIQRQYDEWKVIQQ